MGLSYPLSLSQISLDNTLRHDAPFFRGVNETNAFFIENKIPFFKLREGLTELRNGENTNESGYSFRPTKYNYLSVTDIREGYLDLSDPIYLTDFCGKLLEESKLNDDDIIITRSGTVGLSHLFKALNDGNIYIPSGYLTMIRVNEDIIYPPFAIYYFNTSLIKKFFNTYSCGKDTRNISQTSIMKMPYPSISVEEQKLIYKKVHEFDIRIQSIKNMIPNTQNVIEEVFGNNFGYRPISEYSQKETKSFPMGFDKIGESNHLRLSAKYSYFREFYKGCLFESTKKYPLVKIKNLMNVFKTEIFKKGYLKEKFILIDKPDVEPKTGTIINEEYVDKIESDKVLFGDCDLLVSKIDPFLGHVILNDPTKPYIGTTEFVPYKVNNERACIKFMQNVFLSNNFLELSHYIMAGKRQPRINPGELLNLSIPAPTRDEQLVAVAEIDDILKGTAGQKREIKTLEEDQERCLFSSLKRS